MHFYLLKLAKLSVGFEFDKYQSACSVSQDPAELEPKLETMNVAFSHTSEGQIKEDYF